MAALPVATSTRTTDDLDLEPLRNDFRGPLLRPGQPEYDAARRIYNGMIDRRPAVIAQPTGVADVVTALRFASAHGLAVTVKGGGHNVAGKALVEGGLVLDLARMKGIVVDPQEKTAWVQGGCTWGELDRETQVHGLAVPGGRITSTGVAGFTLGGGIGWTSHQFGLACDHLLEAQVVTSDGRVLTVNDRSHPDLFWGLRGGGAELAVVTAFRFRLREVGPLVYGGLLFYPEDRAADVLAALVRFAPHAPSELAVFGIFMTAPPLPFVPADLQGRRSAGVFVFYNGPAAAAEEAIRPLGELGPPALAMVGPMPYTVLQHVVDEGNPPGIQNYWKSQYFAQMDPATVEAIISAWKTCPSPLTEIHFEFLGGAIAAVGEDATAYSNRATPFMTNYVGKWTDPKDTEANVAWVRALWDTLAPRSTGGVYVNFLGDDAAEAERAAYTGSKSQRLAELKRRYDPGHLLRTKA